MGTGGAGEIGSYYEAKIKYQNKFHEGFNERKRNRSLFIVVDGFLHEACSFSAQVQKRPNLPPYAP